MSTIHIPVCAHCCAPIVQPLGAGRPRVYCSTRCRVAGHRARVVREEFETIEVFEVAPAEASVSAPPVAPVSTDEQVARAILEARMVAGAFLRLGHEVRPAFAWRCENTGLDIKAALDAYFEGI